MYKEALCVGIYCIFLYIIFYFINLYLNLPSYMFLFIFGFIKHFIGYYLGLHQKMCNFINSNHNNYNNYNNIIQINIKILIIECILEGLLFLIIGLITNFEINMLGIYKIFIIGFCIYIFFEIIGLHKWFCSSHFSNNYTNTIKLKLSLIKENKNIYTSNTLSYI